MPQTHIIKKQIFKLDVGQTSTAFEFQKQVAGLWGTGLSKQMDDLLTSFAPVNKTLRIKKLEIDLGTLQLTDLQNELPRKIIEKVRAALEKQIVAEPNSSESNLEIAANANTVVEAFVFYLEKGVLPWWGGALDMNEFENTITKVLEDSGSQYDFLLKKALQDENALDRLLKQFSSDLIHVILTMFSETELKEIFSLQEIHLLRKTLSQLSRKPIALLLNKIDFQLSEAEKNTTASESKAKDGIPSASESQQISYQKIGDQKVSFQHKKNKGYRPENKGGSATEDQGIYLDNAGLVLLAPCVKPLFEKLKLIEDGKFVDRSAQEKAIYVLQYMVGASDHSPEYELPLNKILCGLEVSDPISKNIVISTEGKAEVDQFVQAMIQHWEVLKNTSVAGLQETYLKRNGRLIFNETDNAWYLKVEHKAFDILINKLPWGFSTIKLPWMNNILKTEWIY